MEPWKILGQSAEVPVFTTTDNQQYARDAFGGQRVVQPVILLDAVNTYGFENALFGTATLGSSSVTSVQSQSKLTIACGSGSTDYCKIRTHERFRYQTGRGLRWMISGHLTDFTSSQPTDGRYTRLGLYDDTDGVGYYLSGQQFGIFRRSSTPVGSIELSQSQWNVDTMDGTGWPYNKSGVKLDVNKGSIFEGRVQWLGVGTVDFFINGIHVHSMEHANKFQAPYIRTSHLPISVEITNQKAQSTTGSFSLICAAVHKEGGDEPHGPTFAYSNPVGVAVDASPDSRILYLLRVTSTFRTVADHGVLVFPREISANAEGGRAGVSLYLNPTISGSPSWTAVQNGESVMEVALNSTAEPDTLAMTNSGTFIGRWTMGGDTNGSLSSVPLDNYFGRLKRKIMLRNYGTQGDILAVVGNRFSVSPVIQAVLNWEEIRS